MKIAAFGIRSDVPEACYLRWLIAFKGVSQTEIAGQLGCSPSLVSLWATGKRRPTADNIDALRLLASEHGLLPNQLPPREGVLPAFAQREIALPWERELALIEGNYGVDGLPFTPEAP
jgi:transcriptional regulator with XRE-family HTH domain